MNVKVLVVIFAALMLFTFGCIGGQQPAGGNQGGTNNQPLDLTGKKMSELVGLNIPIECDLHYKNDKGDIVNYKLYIKGQKTRIEAPPELGSIVMIAKSDNFDYANMSNPANCDWLKFESAYASANGAGFVQNPTELDSRAGTTYECKVATFGDEKFETPGRACTIPEAYTINNTTN